MTKIAIKNNHYDKKKLSNMGLNDQKRAKNR